LENAVGVRLLNRTTKAVQRSLVLDTFSLREVPVPRVDRFELAAVNGHTRVAEEIDAPVQYYELAADLADGHAVVLAEIGYRFESGSRRPVSQIS
jgi:hypothetical protein